MYIYIYDTLKEKLYRTSPPRLSEASPWRAQRRADIVSCLICHSEREKIIDVKIK